MSYDVDSIPAGLQGPAWALIVGQAKRHEWGPLPQAWPELLNKVGMWKSDMLETDEVGELYAMVQAASSSDLTGLPARQARAFGMLWNNLWLDRSSASARRSWIVRGARLFQMGRAQRLQEAAGQ